MARSPAPSGAPPSRPHLWWAALLFTVVPLVFGVFSTGRLSGTLAVVYAASAVLALVCLISLRARHLKAGTDTARLRTESQAQKAEAARQDAEWRQYIGRQLELVVEEVGHLASERLPAALAKREIPPPRHGAPQLGAVLADGLERLLSQVSTAVEEREESHRRALIELANRVQTSAHRIQATITGVTERYPGDADLLEATMQVDHAATQQARHAQSLKVLCGEWPGQQWQRPLALVDVVRAASGRIVSFKRVEVTGDPDVGIAAPLVEPLIHLLAELLANATEYSPPRTGVPVTVRTVQRGAVIEVDDGGLGLDEYRLAEAREVASGLRLLGVGDVGEIPQTGFAVVGRFARRHGLGVDLGPSPYGGVRAVVLVPVELLTALPPAGTPAATRVPARPAPPDPKERRAPAARSPQPMTESTASSPAPARGGPLAPPSEHCGSSPSEEPARRPSRRLPQRRSRRDGPTPQVQAEPTAVTPPGSPEDAGDWMEQFFEGGRAETSLTGAHDEYTYGNDHGLSATHPDSTEGQT
ncbi:MULTISPECIES: ATP-binding protein [Streptomyces]|uniref:ATP-binding protein n=1 Tax=Streptomyces TaxID=1883 RepID=UPI00081D4D28|nr:ATP-binding protein [Streptomyces sp. SID4926]SCE13415.1 Signal transduction histidine kinase [Streptomyces sp. DfronAA-171]